jgi:hypothetical protein
MKPTAHYECRAWNKCAERIHVLGLTKGYGLCVGQNSGRKASGMKQKATSRC